MGANHATIQIWLECQGVARSVSEMVRVIGAVLANPRGSSETAKMAAEAPLDRLLRLILNKKKKMQLYQKNSEVVLAI